MRLARVRFTMRRMLAGVAIAATISYIGAGIWEVARHGAIWASSRFSCS